MLPWKLTGERGTQVGSGWRGLVGRWVEFFDEPSACAQHKATSGQGEKLLGLAPSLQGSECGTGRDERRTHVTHVERPTSRAQVGLGGLGCVSGTK